jgi:hypothetical protein
MLVEFLKNARIEYHENGFQIISAGKRSNEKNCF